MPFCKRMTDRQYITKVMLLNEKWVYDKDHHVIDCYPTHDNLHRFLDPDTLEVIPLIDIGMRYLKYVEPLDVDKFMDELLVEDAIIFDTLHKLGD